MTNRHTSLRAVIALAIATLISGAAGLSYEIIWTRMLVVPLGNSADAIALVLCSFMLGMALGARLLGGLADRISSPLKIYVIAEVALGVYAVMMPFVIPALSGSGAPAVVRLVVAAVLVAIPACLMGASVPVLVRALAVVSEDVKNRVGLFYGINTVGGTAGAAFAGFVAVPSLGLIETSFLAAGASIVAALIVAAVSRLSGGVANRKAPAKPEDESGIPARKTAIAALIAAGVGGFVMLASEVVWARILTFVFGHDTYAFAILLVVVLAGLGLGGLLHRLLSKRDPVKVASWMLVLLVVSLFVSYVMATTLIVSLGRDPFHLAGWSNLTTSLWTEFYREILFTPILVLLPAVFAGASLPAACALYAGPASSSGRRIGTAIMVNGIFAATGSIVTWFAIIPTIGIQNTFAFLGVVAALGVIPLLLCEEGTRRVVKMALLALFVVASVGVSTGSNMPRKMLKEAVGKNHQEIIYYNEGRTGTVSVTKNSINGERQLFINAVNEVTTRLVHDQSFKLLGHLGPLLHPKPQKGLMICLGAGLSAGAALRHPLQSLDVVDLSSSMEQAAREFADINNNVLDDPRFHLHIGDGRQFLLRSDERYDVMMVDSTHPKSVDSWILYTLEFYELMRDHLEEDGIAVQWLPLHGLSEREFKIIVRTFMEVFPNTTLWVNVGFETYGQVAYVKLVGTLEPLVIDYRELSARLKEPRIQKDLEPYGMTSPDEILDCFLASPSVATGWTKGVPVQTDNQPFLPYITEHSEGRRMEPALLLAVRSGVAPYLFRMGDREPDVLAKLETTFEAQGFLLSGMLDRAKEAWPDGKKIALFGERLDRGHPYYLALVELYGDDPEKLFEIGSYLGNLGFRKDAGKLYDRALKIDPNNGRAIINRALLHLDLGDTDRAIKSLMGLVASEPDNALARYNLGTAILSSADAASAIPHLVKALEIDPDLHGASLSLAEAYRNMGRLKKAEGLLRELTQRAQWLPEAWDMLGLVEAGRSEWANARQYHSRALALDPYSAQAHYNMGIALQEEGRLKAAAQAYGAALRIQPDDAEAHNNLGLVYAAAGLLEKAAMHHRKALEIEPHYPEAAFNLGLAYRGQHKYLLAAEAFTIALTLAPDLAVAKEQLEQMGIEKAKIDIVDAGPDAGD